VWGLAITITVILGALGFTHPLQGGASLLLGAANAGTTAATAGTSPASRNTPLDQASGLLAAEINRAALQAEGRPGSGAASPTTAAASSSPNATAGAGPTSTNQGGAATAIGGTAASAIALDLLRGKPEAARDRLVAETGMSSEAADNVLRGLASKVDKYRADLRAAADKAQHYISAGLWALFLGSILALVAAALGGWLGAGHIHRVHSEIVRD
jgi:hypothetical protein